MNLLEFYEENKTKYKALDFLTPIIESENKEIKEVDCKKRLKGARNYPALKKLCGGQDEIMFMVLQNFLMLSRYKWADSRATKEKQRLKNEPAKIERYIEKFTHDCGYAIWTVKLIDPEFDEKEFMSVAKKWIIHKVSMKRAGLDKLDDAIELVHMVDKRIDANRLRAKLNTPAIDSEKLFNNTLLQVFRLCKQKTDNTNNAIFQGMADVLNSLKIKTKQDNKKFTRENLRRIIPT